MNASLPGAAFHLSFTTDNRAFLSFTTANACDPIAAGSPVPVSAGTMEHGLSVQGCRHGTAQGNEHVQ
jgi:hypothetical protein